MSFSCLLWLDNRETTFFFETRFRDHLFKFRNGHRRRARPRLSCASTPTTVRLGGMFMGAVVLNPYFVSFSQRRTLSLESRSLSSHLVSCSLKSVRKHALP